jgi:O-antigen/teichoic acid export membrane protein
MNRIIKMLLSRKEFVLYSFMRIMVMLLGLVSNIFIVRKISVSNYGVFSLAYMFIGLLTTFGFSWSSSSIIYYGSREKADTGAMSKTFWARNIIMLTSVVIISLVFIFFYADINAYIGEDLAGLLLIWLLVSVIEDYLIQYFLAAKKQLLSGILSITARIIYIIFVVFITYDVRTLIILNCISHASVLLYVFGINKRDIGSFTFDAKWFKDVLNFSVWQLFGFSGLYLINFGDTAVIKYYMTTEDIGIYNVAYKLFNNIANISYVISGFYASHISECFAKADSKGIRAFYYRERYYILLLCMLAHTLVITFADRILLLLYGSSYSGAVGIFRVLMIGSASKYVLIFYMLYYNICKKHRVLQTLNFIQAVLNLLLDIVFIKFLGLIGPAIATVISMLFITVISAIYCEKSIRSNADGR